MYIIANEGMLKMHVVVFGIFAVVLMLILLSSYRKYEYDKMAIIDRKLTCQLKGMAIIFVVLAHMTLMYYLDLKTIGNFGAIGVDIFLILSGYGIYKSYTKKGICKQFVVKRLKTIYVPFIIVVLFEVLWRFYSENAHYSLYRLITFFTGFDAKRILDGTYWYISYIILWYLIFIIVYKFSKYKILNLILLFYFAYLFKVSKFIDPVKDLSWQYSIHFIAFPIGVLVASYEGKIIKLLANNVYKLVIAILVVGSISAHYVFSYNSDYYWLYNFNVAMFFIVTAIFLQSLGFMSKFLNFVGNISYEIYLVEMQILIYINIPNLVGNKFLGNIIEILCCFAVGFILKWFIKAVQKIISKGLEITHNRFLPKSI
ncbi:acyltransferase family protein [Clostridium hydrogenum]|uniref:acyltransferase family protein n=1 Tax=Clostridium hydrogenum TaxID=2855764 RepID=UPI001F36D20D|nr:acyltransferase [Clostridium hydrogenum]